ncbi:aldo/keto reductase [Mucisphaera calidilacus]|uniref:General stress protein 69 n=1 Tax=Mucisphaera calidilacus TaxID=2527982 RepID=A0A518BUR0_9BACT|nr:aldo/keto reductase [Mucisphaera calidilacus]QDU70718.1 General stress protein 69 [Mucisphaera calidilacus]
MDMRTIPGTDLTVSLLAFGNFVFGTNWWGDFSDDEAVSIQNRAVDLGVTFFDTAPAYGNGRAEQLLGRTIREIGREKLTISTKFGYDLVADPGVEGSHRERRQNFSPAHVRRELEQSLRDLDIETIDLYQAHNIKLEHYADELFETLETLKVEGKIRHWGVALGPAIGWREEGHQALLERSAATVQTVYNLYEQAPGRELCEIATQTGKGGVIARVPTNSGILDDEFKSPDHKFAQNDHRKFRDKAWLVYGLKKNDMVRPVAEQLGLSLRQLATKWLASQPGLVSIEPNMLSLEDVTEYAAACAGDALPDAVLKQLSSWYDDDYGLGDEAHPCDIKSSTAEGGAVRSDYLAPSLT